MRRASMGSGWPRGATTDLGVLRALTWGGLLLWAILLLAWPVQGEAAEQAEVEKAEVEYAKGIEAYSNGDYEGALKHFRTTVELVPDNLDAQFYLGLTLNQLKKFQEAIVPLEKALQLDEGYVHHPLGLAYFKEKRYEQALKQFKLAENFDPENAVIQSSLYQLGLELYALERDGEAQKAFDAARAGPETAIASNAQRYLAAIARRAREQRLVQLQGTVGFQYDDNVALEPDDDVFAISDEGDVRAVFTLDAKLLPVRTPVWRLGAEYALYQSLHLDLNEFDVQSHTVGLFSRAKLGRVTLRLAANYNFTFLDNDDFSEAVTILPSALIRQTETLFAVVSVRYRLSDFSDITPDGEAVDADVRDRDGWTVRPGFDQYFLFNKKRSYVRLSYYYEASRNDGSDWEFDGHHVGVGLHTSLAQGLTLDVDWSYIHRDYLHVNSFDASPFGIRTREDQDDRSDNRFAGSVALTQELGRNFLLSFIFEHITSLSNIDFFQYDRNIMTVALTGRY